MKKTPKELSSEYYQFVNSFTQTSFEDEKMLGKFYTDHDIAESMIHIIRDIYKPDRFGSELRIIDPFCGDGRLILKLIATMTENCMIESLSVFVSLWDIDASAVEKAKGSLEEFCKGNHRWRFERAYR